MTKLACLLLCGVLAAGLRAQEPAPPPVDPLHRPFDTILDIYVRDGLVYYRALKLERPAFRSVRAVTGRGPGAVRRPEPATRLLGERLQRVRPAHGDR